MKGRKLLLVMSIVILLGSILLAGCGQDKEPIGDDLDKKVKEQNYVFKIGMVSPPSHPYTIGSQKFANAVNEKSDGRITIEVYHSGQLGGERDLIEQVQYGTLDMALVTIGPISNFIDDFAVFDMPFVFANREHAYKTLDGPVGQEVLAMLQNINITGLGYWENGFRHLSNSIKPIHTIDDMKGMKMRVMENEIQMETFRALGADPTPISWPETYTALQQGVVDGFETSIGVFETSRMYEVQNQFSILNFFYQGAVLMINEDILNSLSSDLQAIIADLGHEYGNFQRQMIVEMEKDQLVNMEAEDVEIVYDVNTEPFIKATEGIYDRFEDRFGQYYDRIQAELP